MATAKPAKDKSLERLRARQEERAKDAPPQEPPTSFLMEIRHWIDALVFAYVLAMFIRSYVFELFMIPTGSMTPALIGDDARQVAEIDWNNDGIKDIVAQPQRTGCEVFIKRRDGTFDPPLFFDNIREAPMWETLEQVSKTSTGRTDMILVNKFAYWFRRPERGEIAVFKVPYKPDLGFGNPFAPDKPVFIKRVCGLPGETITLNPIREKAFLPGQPGRKSPDAWGGLERQVAGSPMIIDGKPYRTPLYDRVPHFPYSQNPRPAELPQTFKIGDDEVMMFGDHQANSSDSRRWGGVPLSNMRGRAVLRYWPLRAASFLRHDPDDGGKPSE